MNLIWFQPLDCESTHLTQSEKEMSYTYQILSSLQVPELDKCGHCFNSVNFVIIRYAALVTGAPREDASSHCVKGSITEAEN